MGDPTTTSEIATDNIVARRKNIKESLSVIRDKKERLRQAMKAISENETPDVEMLSKLLNAFDMMTEQENQYLEVLRGIVTIHEQAADDIAKEIALKKELEEEIPKIDIGDDQKPAENPATGEQIEEMQQLLKELAATQQQALAASLLHDQLTERLQLHKNKKSTLDEIRRQKAAKLKKDANKAMEEVEEAKLNLTAEKNIKNRKKKELEKLRKKALQKGIELGVVEEQEREAILRAAKESSERLPPIENEEKKEDVKPELTDEEKLEERRRQIRENVRKAREERDKKEQTTQLIRERLKAMEARRQRVQQLRIMLQQATAQAEAEAGREEETTSTEKKTPDEAEAKDLTEEERAQRALEETLNNAKSNLMNLTAMRERLEELQRNGESIGDEDIALIDALDGGGKAPEEVPEERAAEKSPESKPVTIEHDQIRHADSDDVVEESS